MNLHVGGGEARRTRSSTYFGGSICPWQLADLRLRGLDLLVDAEQRT